MLNSVKRTQEEKADSLKANGLVDNHIEESISNNVFEAPKLIARFTNNLQTANLSKYITYYKKLDSFLSQGQARNCKKHLEFLIAHGDVSYRNFQAETETVPDKTYEYEKFLNFKGFYKVDLQASKEPAVTWHIEEVVDISDNLDKWLIVEENPAGAADAPDHTSPSLLLHPEFRDHLNSELEEVETAHRSCGISTKRRLPKPTRRALSSCSTKNWQLSSASCPWRRCSEPLTRSRSSRPS